MHVDILYTILYCADQWGQKQGGEQSINSQTQNSHPTLITKSTESPNKNEEETGGMQKGPY